MNIIICDDRIDDRKNLSDLLSDYGEKKNYEFAITEYDSGEQLCEEQSALEACQILFLDINMQGLMAETAMRIKEKILEFCFVEGTIKLYADDIIYIETDFTKCILYFEKGTFQIYKNWMNWKMNLRI